MAFGGGVHACSHSDSGSPRALITHEPPSHANVFGVGGAASTAPASRARDKVKAINMLLLLLLLLHGHHTTAAGNNAA